MSESFHLTSLFFSPWVGGGAESKKSIHPTAFRPPLHSLIPRTRGESRPEGDHVDEHGLFGALSACVRGSSPD